MSTLRASVAAAESGPLILLAGEADITNVAELSDLVNGQLVTQTRYLTVDVSGLAFADTASIRVLLLAAGTLRKRGGDLVLLRPQRALLRMLDILGASALMTVQGRPETASEP